MAQSDLEALTEAARSAWLYCLPLIEVANARTTGFPAAAPVNAVGHNPNLVDHTFRAITTPNNDTLYSTIYMDLSQGPVSLTLPASGARYLSVALMDAYTNNFAILGTRTTGTKGGTFKIVGPADSADGPRVVRSPTNHVWALARILVTGPEDLEAARLVQAGFTVQGPAAPPMAAHARRTDRADVAEQVFKERFVPAQRGRGIAIGIKPHHPLHTAAFGGNHIARLVKADCQDHVAGDARTGEGRLLGAAGNVVPHRVAELADQRGTAQRALHRFAVVEARLHRGHQNFIHQIAALVLDRRAARRQREQAKAGDNAQTGPNCGIHRLDVLQLVSRQPASALRLAVSALYAGRKPYGLARA